MTANARLTKCVKEWSKAHSLRNVNSKLGGNNYGI